MLGLWTKFNKMFMHWSSSDLRSLMGSSSSKPAKNDALHLCKERVKCISQVLESRNALSAAHLSYMQSLQSIGTALRHFAEANLSVESSISLSEVGDSPPYSSCGSPSSSRFVEHISSASGSGSPLSTRMPSMNYMRATGASVLTVTIDSLATSFVDDGALTTPYYRDIASSDYFDPTSSVTNLQLLNGQPCQRITCRGKPQEEEVIPFSQGEAMKSCNEKQSEQNNVSLEGFNEEFKSVTLTHDVGHDKSLNSGSPIVKESIETIITIASSEISASGRESRKVQREILAEREDASEFITHRAKCFLSSMRDIEHRFLRSAEAGNEISQMLETNKLRLHNDFDGRGISSSSQLASVLNRVCCKGQPFLKRGGSLQNMTKTIKWKHSITSLSSPSRIPLTSAAKDDADNTASDFTEELCMISRNHSSTLDRLYAWECKLYDEIKYNEDIGKVYDRKCWQLRHQCARDQDTGLIDSTRAIVKDLHSRMGVSIQSVESISKRIEMLRDSELQPQLVELIRGLIRMWKSMLECHHAQFITISLAYLTKTEMSPGEPHRQALVHVRNQLSNFNGNFSTWINAYKLYVEALSSWLQKCILQPQERRKGRRDTVFPPRQALSPPIFVLCSDWLLGLKSLPARELTDSIEAVIAILLHESFEQAVEGAGEVADQPECNQGSGAKQEQICGRRSSLHELKASLTRLFDRLTKFSEISLRVHEDVKQASEIAYIAYASVVIE